MPVEPETAQFRVKTGFLSLPVLRDVALVALIVIVAWKLLNAEFKFDLATFSFSDFLALVLALFSVALSVAFYFKATEASNQFYDNTYRFTKEMSEILGRIEAGFGERLRHLDEGYSGVRERLERFSQNGGATLLDVEKEKEEIRKKEGEQKALIEDLANKAQLAQHEKLALFANLAAKERELERARNELREMQASLQIRSGLERSVPEIVKHVVQKLRLHSSRGLTGPRISPSGVPRVFDAIKPHLSASVFAELENAGLLTPEGDLSREAMQLISMELSKG